MANLVLKPCSLISKLRTNIDDLSDNLLVEVLHRLPCELLVRSKSVSKELVHSNLRLIFSPKQKQQQDQQEKKVCTFVSGGSELLIIPKAIALLGGGPEFPLSLSESTLRFQFLQQFKVIGYSNGLFLCTKSEFEPRVY
ncbi:hypothetical protein O6P43_021901 [Quillaja saponaria]|uniref:F-box domain-containing protein n=1 Tax=Quillaja saponaria TaxID=32244 RepID=A0AAD7LC17_QUISA|nr:hypothetical protein O6P43_021901 [Quillaja saponaria]